MEKLELNNLFKNPFAGYLQVILFLNLFFSFFFFRQPFDFYVGYIGFVLLLPMLMIKYGLPRLIWTIFGVLALAGFVQIIMGNNTVTSFLKVFVGMSASYLFFHYIVFDLGFKATTLFKFYLKGAFICALVGIFQLLSYAVGFTPGYDFTWIMSSWGVVPGGVFGIRVSTFFGEPSYHAMFLSGAVFIALHDLIYQQRAFFFSRLYATIMIIGVYISFSGTIISTFILSVILVGLNYGLARYLFIGFPLTALIVFQLVRSNDEFLSRYEGTVNIFLDSPQQAFNVLQYHGSSVILYNNFFVAKENFKRNPFFGTGLGSHPVAVDKYSLTKDIEIEGFALNAKDANSMFNRLMSETGLFGMGLVIFILYKFYIRRNEKDKEQLWLISAACLVVILANMLRQGHYFLNGFPFYMWMFYKVYLERKVILDQSEEEDQTVLVEAGEG